MHKIKINHLSTPTHRQTQSRVLIIIELEVNIYKSDAL